MTTRKFAFAAFAAAATLAATLASGAAQARGPVDVQWQVTIGSPMGGFPGYGGVVVQQPVYLPPPVVLVPRYQPQYQQQYQPIYREPSRWDVDGDGIPNRYDRVYNPRWDRGGNGRYYDPGQRYEPGHDRRDERRNARRDDRRDEHQDDDH